MQDQKNANFLSGAGYNLRGTSGRRASWEEHGGEAGQCGDLKYTFHRRQREQLKVRDLSLLVHCEVDLINGGHWEGAHVGASTWW